MTDKDDNVYQLFSKQNKQESKIPPPHSETTEQNLEEHFAHFLNTLDTSLDTFNQLSVMEKYSLYSTLVGFTHVVLDSYLKLKGE